MAGNNLVVSVEHVVYFIVIFGSFVACETSDGSKDGLTITLEHAVGTGSPLEFQQRGQIIIRNMKGLSGTYKDNDELSSKDFQRLLKDSADKGNFYHIRVAIQPSESEESQDLFHLSTFIKTCSLLQSNFSDIIKLNVDHTGQIFAIGLSTTTADCSGLDSNYLNVAGIDSFNTSVILSHVNPGPVPETQTYIKKLEDERREKEQGKGKDNRSFFGKYWMYIVPLVIFLVLSAQEPPAGGAAAGSGGAAAS